MRTIILPGTKGIIAASFAFFMLGLCSLGGAENLHPHVSLPDLDRRVEARGPNPVAPQLATAASRAAARLDAEAILRSRLANLNLDRHPILGSPRWVAAADGFLTGRNGVGRGAGANLAAGLRPDDPHRVVKSFVNEHAAVFGHDAGALERARVERDYAASHNGMRTTVWQQEHEGIPMFHSLFIGHVTKNGELVNVASQFLTDPAQAARTGHPNRQAGVIAPAIAAAQAVRLASVHLGEEEALAAGATAEGESVGPERRQAFHGGALKGEAIVRLVWLPLDESTMRLCWRVMLKTRGHAERYRVLVDAETGEVWKRDCMTTDISNASYRVYLGDSPTPLSPGYPTPGNTNQPGTAPRTLVTLSALSTTASPNGWIDDGVNETRGNNVDAHTDLDADDLPDLPRPQGSPSRVFDFPVNLAQEPANYRNASVVNLFYWCNWMHDKLYDLGFTEAAGNFQNNNFGRGGVGNDAVRAQAQDGECRSSNFRRNADSRRRQRDNRK